MKDQRRIAAARRKTFLDCADGYLAANANSWKNAKHRQQWLNTLAIYPQLGEWPVRDIDIGIIVKVLSPIWHEEPETARWVRVQIETIREWAIAAKHYDGWWRRRTT